MIGVGRTVTVLNLLVDLPHQAPDHHGMHSILHVGFESATFSFEGDITVDALIDMIVEHVDIFAEAMKAAELLEGIWDSASYEGTGWRVWFVRKDAGPVLH